MGSIGLVNLGKADNLLINGDFKIWQRGASFTAPENKYTADRMRCNGSGTVSKDANGMKVTGTVTLNYVMETDDFAKISGKTVTLSYSKNGVITTSTFTASTATVVNLTLTDCTLNWIKLEVGSIASPFVPRLTAEELALCQRYYEKNYDMDVDPSGISGSGTGMQPSIQYCASYATAWNLAPFAVRKRVKPTVKIYSILGVEGRYSTIVGNDNGTAYATGITEKNFVIQAVDAETMVVKESYCIFYVADAEIY